jgi:hypothetical protein
LTRGGWLTRPVGLSSAGQQISGLRDDYLSGDLGFDPLHLCPTTDEGFIDMRSKELNHGRLAMVAFVIMAVQELMMNRPMFDGMM